MRDSEMLVANQSFAKITGVASSREATATEAKFGTATGG